MGCKLGGGGPLGGGESWDIPPVFKFLQKHGNVDQAEMFRVFNMGIGYVMTVRPHFAEQVAANPDFRLTVSQSPPEPLQVKPQTAT